ncbi:hypothetical protein [Thermovibrio sp.]
MRVRKLLVGIIFLALFTCCYHPEAYSFDFEPSVKVELVLVKSTLEVKRSSPSYSSLVKVRKTESSLPSFKSFHIYASPPRASP